MRMMIAAAVGAAVIGLSAGCQTSTIGAPAPTSAPSVAASATPSATASPAADKPAAKWSGTVYAFSTGRDNRVDVYALTGASRKLIASTPPGEDSCAPLSVSVSPDGTMVAWVNTGRGVSLDGDLFIGTIGGAPAKKVATHIICGGKAPTWSPDSRSMQVAQRSGDKVTYGLISAASGAFTEAKDLGHVWSPSGGLVAQRGADRKSVTIAKADGTVVRTFNYQPDWTHCEGWLPQTLSEDGRYLSVGYAACDPSRMLGVERVVDTTTGKEIALPVAKVERVYFRTDGSMIAIAQNTGYVIVDGAVVARQQLAADGLEILSYTA